MASACVRSRLGFARIGSDRVVEIVGHDAVQVAATDAISSDNVRASAPKLIISRLSKRYGAVAALSHIDLDVQEGEFLTLLGPSGSGKTTLLMAIAGFVEPSEGRIVLDGRDITDTKPERRDLGMVFQGYALFPHMTVRQNIAFPLRVRRQPASKIDRIVAESLELMQLCAMGDRLPKQLSGGQQQRVALARALCFRPRILLLDEPLAALDKNLRATMQAEIQRLHRQLGTTFIFVTHDQSEALSLSDRIAIFRSGRIEQIGSPSRLYNEPASSFVASFLGETNFLTGSVTSVGGGFARLDCAGTLVVARNLSQAASGSTATAAVRPECITVEARQASNGLVAENEVAGRVVGWNFLGGDILLHLLIPDGRTIVARVLASRSKDLLVEHQEVIARWEARDATLVPESNDPIATNNEEGER